ncbi:DUF1707 SHOCT-like domain-containing protein [Candidatus Solirubrobacter pratensis]|uniref:DUF1707 SHOCT-like domain-containing protein n=1 Tax=Candidatus Solirubrobacter pratensis TaxID=1298857 RepID=UPI00040E6E8A|nr:DUF1707 domain-containing protein [Candidatus Solirubrobacter pratensis]
MRAGDDDRDRTIALLRDAAVAGRLTLEEFAGRVERAELARTQSELEPLTADLPAAGAADLPLRHSAIFSRLERRGRWELAPRATLRCVCGTVVLDLGRATLHGAETSLDIRNWFGTVTILVPRGVHVEVDGGGPFGTREIDLPDAGPVADAPRLRIRTSGPGGTLRVAMSSRERDGL